MPRGDGTGPTGQGPMGGGGQGFAIGGRGQSRGARGRGGGGWGRREWPADLHQPPTYGAPPAHTTSSVPPKEKTGDVTDSLKNELALFRQQLQECREAIAELNQRILELSRVPERQSAPKGTKQEEAKDNGGGETED